MSKAKSIVLDSEATLTEPASLIDMSRYRNDGVFTDITMSQLPSGLQVYGLNGTTSVIDFSNPSSLQLTSVFSLETWIYLKDDNPNYFLSKDSFVGGDRGWYFGCPTIGSTSVRLLVSSDGTALTYFSTTSSLTQSTWYHCCGVYDGTSLIIYVNGSSWAGTTIGAVPSSIFDSSDDCHAGEGFGSYLNGNIALPRIYNYALSAGQILTRFTQTRAWFGI